MTIAGIAQWAVKKGIGLVATGDWTHPMWMREVQQTLEEIDTGLLRLKSTNLQINKSTNDKNPTNPTNLTNKNSPLFLLSTEISCIYSQAGKTRRVHVLVWVPSIASAQKISQELTKRGCNLMSDGRPIIGLSLINLSELVLTIEPNALIVPAHAWTPWFSVYGQMGGFESLEEAFGPFAKNIYAVETGLSSSPDMNWRIKELDTRAIVSFSDAHSGPKLGREATVFDLESVCFENIRKALMPPSQRTALPAGRQEGRGQMADNPSSDFRFPSSNCISYTIEFYPEEGKYHYTGHRDCRVRLTPEETIAKGTTCPVCGKPLTQGVSDRVEQLAGRSLEQLQISNDKCQINVENAEMSNVRLIKTNAVLTKPPFVMLVPLQEIIAEAIGSPPTSVKTQSQYNVLTSHFNGEFNVLLCASLDEIGGISTKEIADGVRKVRIGDIVVDPGYDGVFGVVKIWKSDEEKSLVDRSKEQLGLF
jgi:PHP family Zn ribbon phosphoesterase